MAVVNSSSSRCALSSLPLDVWRDVISFLSLRDLFHLEATSKEMSWVIENAHWSTVTSIELIAYLRRDWRLDVNNALRSLHLLLAH